MTKLRFPQSKDVLRSLLKERAIQHYLNSLKEHHPETYHHSVRVGLLCLDIGLELSLEQPELNLLGYAGLLHDIGKRRISEDILSKSSPLSPEEREIMKEHPRLGFLELDEAGFEVVGAAVVAHHEFKIDPYPRQGQDRRGGRRDDGGRRAESELAALLGEVVAVADIYDALSNRRAYKPAMSKDKVEAVLREQFTGSERLIQSVMQRYDAEDQEKPQDEMR